MSTLSDIFCIIDVGQNLDNNTSQDQSADALIETAILAITKLYFSFYHFL